MRKNNRILGVVTAAALAVSNLSMVAAPFTGIIAQAAITSKVVVAAKKTGTDDALTTNALSVTIGKSGVATFDVLHSFTATAGAGETADQLAADQLAKTKAFTFDKNSIVIAATAGGNNDSLTAVQNGVKVGTIVKDETAYTARVPITINIDASASGIVESRYTLTFDGTDADYVFTINLTADGDITPSGGNTIGFAHKVDANGDYEELVTTNADGENVVEKTAYVTAAGTYEFDAGLLVGSRVAFIADELSDDEADAKGDAIGAYAAGPPVVPGVAYYLKVESSKKAVATVAQAAGGTTDQDSFVITDVAPGTTKITANLMKVTSNDGISTTETSIGSGSFNYTVVGLPVAINVLENGAVAQTFNLDQDTPSRTYTTKPVSVSFDVSENVKWLISKEDAAIVEVKQSGNGATLTAKGNGNATVYVVPEADTQFWTEYNKDTSKLATAITKATTKATLNVTAAGQDLAISPSEDKVNIFLGEGKTGSVVINTNDGTNTITAGSKATTTNVVYTVTSDETIVKAAVQADYKTILLTPVAVGKTVVNVVGEYKKNVNGVDQDVKVTTSFTVEVVDTEKAAELLKEAEDKAAAAETAQKAAEDAATAAKADATAQKTAAEAATKEAAAAKEAATKAAAAQKAAEDKATAAEKKAADAAAAATGIKKGATKAVKGQTFKATSSKAVTLTKIKNAKTVTVGSTVEINDQVYKVTALGKGALKAGKATKLTVDAQFLTKKGINADCAKGTGKIKTLIIKNQTKKAAPAKALVKAVKKYNKKVKVQYK